MNEGEAKHEKAKGARSLAPTELKIPEIISNYTMEMPERPGPLSLCPRPPRQSCGSKHLIGGQYGAEGGWVWGRLDVHPST